MSALEQLFALFQDPPPEFVFEIAANGIAMSRTRPPMSIRHLPLAGGIIVPSPVKENVIDHEGFAHAVATLVPAAGGRGRRACTLIVPDNSLRLSVIDFDKLPEKEEERVALIKFRMRKTLPFDIDEAAFSYTVQKGNRAIVAVAPIEIISRYEAPFRAAGLHPGLVTSSSLAMLELLPAIGSYLVAHRSPGALTVLAVEHGVLVLVRSLELTAHAGDPLKEISEDLYPTLVYIEDQVGLRPDKLLIVGFGDDSDTAAQRLAVELDIAVEAIHEEHPGLTGYLRSLTLSQKPQRKVAA